ncbi:hypothetical protein CEXT_338791 [Caerostris extrusa]|uniref:Uncharacterized protein n=1 Tax=Caerostris extrusa TaxID=172846 RepID=A0AAV4TJF9_CAEEX|nr:hypothetical protein CEXT_338791 [Caerostris extrusa]
MRIPFFPENRLSYVGPIDSIPCNIYRCPQERTIWLRNPELSILAENSWELLIPPTLDAVVVWYVMILCVKHSFGCIAMEEMLDSHLQKDIDMGAAFVSGLMRGLK